MGSFGRTRVSLHSHVVVSNEFLQCTDKLNAANFCLRTGLCNLNSLYNINEVERSKNANAWYQFGSIAPRKRLSRQHLSLRLTFPQVSDSTLALFVLLKRVMKKQTNRRCAKI